MSLKLGTMSLLKEHVIHVLLACFATGIFLHQVYLNYNLFMAGTTEFLEVPDDQGVVFTPPVLVCPDFVLDPRGLLHFGLTLDPDNYFLSFLYLQMLEGVPNNTYTLMEVYEKAAWPLGHLIEEVWVGNLHEKYNLSTKITPLWELVVKGSLCYQLKPLPVPASTIMILKTRSPSDVFGGKPTPQNATEEVDPGTEFASKMVVSVFDIFLYMESLSTEYMRDRAYYRKLSPLGNCTVESYSVKLTKNRGNARVDQCRKNCYTEDAAENKFCFQKLPTHAENLLTVCSFRRYDSFPKSCLEKCGSGLVENKWRMVQRISGSDQGAYSVTVISRNKHFAESAIYTAPNLFSDIGGSLGLFIGVSFASFFSWFETALRFIRVKLKKIWLSLGSYSYTLLLLVFAAVHTCLILNDMAYPQIRRCVILSYGTGAASHSEFLDHTEVSAETAMAERFASRIVGCRSFTHNDAMTQCLISTMNSRGIIPFLNISDLPACHISGIALPVKKIIIPTEYLKKEENVSKILDCKNLANRSSQSRDSNSTTYVFEHFFEYDSDAMDFFVQIGGIVGLYFGISISQVLGNTLSKVSLKNFDRYKNRFQISCLFLLLVTAVGACLYQIQIFFFSHPVSFRTESIYGNEKFPVSVTICPWPPVNIQRLLDYTDVSKENDSNWNEILTDRFSNNLTFLQQAWKESVWNESELPNLLINFTPAPMMEWSSSNVLGFTCYTPDLSTNSRTSLFFNYYDKEPVSHIFYNFHAIDTVPIINIYFKKDRFFRGSVTGISNYRGNGRNSTESFGFCFNKCLEDSLYARIKCDIPLVSSKHSGRSCSKSLIQEFVEWIFQPKLNHNEPYLYWELIQPSFETCKHLCVKTSKAFLRLQEDGEAQVFADYSFTAVANKVVLKVSANMDSQELIEEEDRYTSSQLVSEVGSIVGIILGVSLFSLCKMIFDVTLGKWETFNSS